jgi:hypothetical protein
MMAPGKPFAYSDLAPLLALANSRASNSFNLAGFYDVDPMYNDPSGNKYGYRQCQGFALAAQGTGYAPGDVVTLLNGSATVATFEVVMVTTTGAIIGLLVLTNPGFAPGGAGSTITANDPASPGALTGGSGTGATITFTVAQVGPQAQYALPDYTLGVGSVTGLVLNAAGTGYQVGDTLTLPQLATSTGTPSAHVTTVNGSGAITAFSVTGLVGTLTIPAVMTSLPATGGHGTGATFTGLFTLPQRPQWLTELNRLRNALQGSVTSLSGAEMSVSGPWPISGPDPDYKNQVFYFPDTGSGVSLTITSNFGSQINDTLETFAFFQSYFNGTPLTAPLRFMRTDTFVMVIGGSAPVQIDGVFAITIEWNWGAQGHQYSYSTGRVDFLNQTVAAPSAPSVSGNFPGTLNISIGAAAPANREQGGIAGNGYNYGSTVGNAMGNTYVSNIVVSYTVHQTVAPGIYTFAVDVGAGGGDEVTNAWGDAANDEFTTWVWPPLISIQGGFNTGNGANGAPNATASLTINSGAVPTAGIHNSKTVFKLPLGADTNGINAIIGQQIYDLKNPSDTTWTQTGVQPTWLPMVTRMSGWSITGLPPGFWTGVIPMLCDLKAVTFDLMPWNQIRTSNIDPHSAHWNPALLGDQANEDLVSNSYDNTQPVEAQAEPPAWMAATYFSKGFTILDSNGNLQTVTTVGTSGSTEPVWGTNVNSGTTDGGVQWVCAFAFKAPADTWSAHVVYALGAQIVDANGFFQQAVAVTSPGYSSTREPHWATAMGAQTVDFQVTWQVVGSTPRMHAAPHRLGGYPRYPIQWCSETITKLMVPTATSGLTIWGAYNQWQRNTWKATPLPAQYDPGWQQDNQAYGWWIYSVSLNRMKTVNKTLPAVAGNLIGAGDTGMTGIGAGDTGGLGAGGGAAAVSGDGEVSVTIGCMRNGAFVAFGTYLTGQTVKVLWPVFTSDALFYQCSERVDIQALAIASGNTVLMGPTAALPICAAFITDTEALLKLIV